MSDTDTPFGCGDTVDDARAELSVYVRRSLNDYTNLEEVFEFFQTEPDVSAVNKDGAMYSVRYYLTQESRNGLPGCSNYEYRCGAKPATSLPDEVLERAAAMVEWVEVPQGDD